MEVKKGKTLDTGRRVQGFLDTQTANIGTAVTPALRAKLDESVQQLATAGVMQESAAASTRTETVRQEALRKALYDNVLAHMSLVARAVVEMKEDRSALAVPASAEQSAGFVGKASAAADAAAPFEALFVAHGLATDFIAQLRAGVAQVVASQQAQQRYISARATATGTIEAADKTLRQTIGFVNAALKPVLKKDPSLAAGWKASKLIHATVVNPISTGSPVLTQSASNDPADAPPSAPPAGPVPTPPAPTPAAS